MFYEAKKFHVLVVEYDIIQTMNERDKEQLPEHFLEGEKYYQELRENPEWLKANDNKYLAIMGREIVDQDGSFQELSLRVRETHGYGAIFMPFVEVNPRPVVIRPRIIVQRPNQTQ